MQSGRRDQQGRRRNCIGEGSAKHDVALPANSGEKASIPTLTQRAVNGQKETPQPIDPLTRRRKRLHHVAGGGHIKPGFIYGKTDEIGCNAIDEVVHVHD